MKSWRRSQGILSWLILEAITSSSPRAKVGRIESAYHEEMALAVHNCGAAFTVRSVQSIQRRWPGPDGGAAFCVPH